MIPTRSRSRWLPGLLLAVACGGGGGPSAPGAPTDLRVAQDPGGFDLLDFSWTPPASDLTGYEGEGRLGAGDWQSLGEPIPGNAVGGVLALAPSLPEAQDLAFRIRALRGGLSGPWSAEATVHRGLRWPTAITSAAVPEGVRLEWQSGSLLATGVRVVRLLDGAWQPLADLPATATSYLDTGHLAPDQVMSYQLLATRGTEASLPAHHTFPGFPTAAPTDFTATVEAGGVRLRWTVPGTWAPGFEVRRADGVDLLGGRAVSPVLPAGTAEYLDPAPPGPHVYVVATVYGLFGVYDPESERVTVLSPPSGSAALDGALVALPPASGVSGDAAGRLAFALGSSFYPPATGPQALVFRGPDVPPDRELGTNHGFVAPAVRLDGDGHPHTVLLRPTADPGVQRLVHVWHDGTAWREATVTEGAFADPTTMRFDCDAEGAVHVLWVATGATSAGGYARPVAGGWAVEELSAALPPAIHGLLSFAVDGLGAPALLLRVGVGSGSAGHLALLRRGATGWTAETTPDPGDGAYSYAGALFPVPGGIGLAVIRCAGTDLGSELVELAATAAGFGAERHVAEYAQCLPVDLLGAGATGDGSRVAIWAAPIGRLGVHLRSAGQAWTGAATGLQAMSPAGGWFDGTGRLHLLVRTTGSSGVGGAVPWAAYVER